MIGIGIDTGGTCTDAVMIDTRDKRVLSYGKTPTTKRDLKEGILNALNSLDQNLVWKAEFLSLSTTLATNACVEGKGGRAKLVFIGVKKAFVEKMQDVYGLPAADEIYFLEGDPARKNNDGNLPDWESFRKDVREKFRDFDSVAVVQINPRYNDGQYEKEAEAIIREELKVPCVRGYELYQEINVQKRGATALLNARLLPVMKDFFDSIDGSLRKLGISPKIQVVKSDGTIMDKEYAMQRPVETLLCGPAASIIGAMELAEIGDGLIVDIGGTTSDVALVKNGVPVASEGGISIGPWKTMVKGVTIDTFALGGDSGVYCEENEILLGARRVMPLCMIGAEYPGVVEKLRDLTANYAVYSYPAYQFFLLQNVPDRPEKFNSGERTLIEALKDGPLSFAEAAEAVGVSPYLLKTERLENEGVILRCGVTPTDVMHVKGDFTDYSTEASRYGISYLSMAVRKPFPEVCDRIYKLAKGRLYNHLVQILLKYEGNTVLTEDDGRTLQKLTDSIFERKFSKKKSAFIEPDFSAKTDLIGIGAPSGIFMEDMGRLLNTSAVFPPYAMVANAIGAAVGSIVSEYVVQIEPCSAKDGCSNYMVTGGEKAEFFEYYQDAVKRGKEIAEQRALTRVKEQGAEGEILTEIKVYEDFYEMAGHGSKLLIETKIVGRAAMK